MTLIPKITQLSFPTIINNSRVPELYANIFEKILGYIFLKKKKLKQYSLMKLRALLKII